MNTKLVTNMTDEEIRAEISRLQSINIPKERQPGAPPRMKKESKSTAAKRPSWRDQLDL